MLNDRAAPVVLRALEPPLVRIQRLIFLVFCRLTPLQDGRDWPPCYHSSLLLLDYDHDDCNTIVSTAIQSWLPSYSHFVSRYMRAESPLRGGWDCLTWSQRRRWELRVEILRLVVDECHHERPTKTYVNCGLLSSRNQYSTCRITMLYSFPCAEVIWRRRCSCGGFSCKQARSLPTTIVCNN